ncbi:MAG: hypothetical protein IKJ05_03555 [Oscillospiraceae bacterium]|nr:hypothetical protein [Oscillospiraceae bacterium]
MFHAVSKLTVLMLIYYNASALLTQEGKTYIIKAMQNIIVAVLVLIAGGSVYAI